MTTTRKYMRRVEREYDDQGCNRMPTPEEIRLECEKLRELCPRPMVGYTEPETCIPCFGSEKGPGGVLHYSPRVLPRG